MTTDEIIMTRPKEQDYFIRATYVRQLENYCDELENEIIEQLVAERDDLRAKLAELEAQEPVAYGSFNKQGDLCSHSKHKDSWHAVPLYKRGTP